MIKKNCLAILMGLAYGTVQAQPSCPGNQIRLVVPWSAGGATDAVGRLLSVPLGEKLGNSIVVDNRPGAGGIIGTKQMVREKPDGCTLLLATSSTNAAAPHLYSEVGFDPLRDFTPIGFVVSIPNVLVVATNASWRSVAELVAAAKAQPGSFSYGSGGIGSSQHLAGAMLNKTASIELAHVPYKSSAPAIVDLMGGHVSMVLDTGSLTHIRAGKLRPLAVASQTRLSVLPDVPTFGEAGVPGLIANFWVGVAGPAGMDPGQARHISTALNEVVQSPVVRQQLTDMGGEVRASTPETFSVFWESEISRYAEIVKMADEKTKN